MKTGAAVRQITALTFLTVSFGLLGAANAQQPTQAQKNAIRSACRSDYMAHCASVPTGGKASLECLQQNMASLSASCQSAVNAIAGGGAATPDAGQAPAEAPAPQSPAPSAAAPTEPAPPATEAGAPPPRREYPPMSPRQEMAILRWSCGPDFRALCGDVPPGGGRVVACLRDNAPSLSPRCRRALMGAGRR
jgi:hypothetical protein